MAVELSVIVPAYQEARRLPATLPAVIGELRQIGHDWELRVVDDGSTDDTAAVVETLAADEPRVVVQREPHRGKGAAVRAGMLTSTAAHRVSCDADFSMRPHELERLLAPLAQGADVVIASREAPGATRIGEPLHRRWLGHAFRRFVQIVALPGITDSQCGFKAYTARAAELCFAELAIEGFAFDVELLLRARRLGLDVREVAIDWRYDPDTRVHALRDGLHMARDVLRARLRVR